MNTKRTKNLLIFPGLCPDPGGVPFSNRTRYNGPYYLGSVVTYSCYEGDVTTITCQSNGNWEGKFTCSGTTSSHNCNFFPEFVSSLSIEERDRSFDVYSKHQQWRRPCYVTNTRQIFVDFLTKHRRCYVNIHKLLCCSLRHFPILSPFTDTDAAGDSGPDWIETIIAVPVLLVLALALTLLYKERFVHQQILLPFLSPVVQNLVCYKNNFVIFCPLSFSMSIILPDDFLLEEVLVFQVRSEIVWCFL